MNIRPTDHAAPLTLPPMPPTDDRRPYGVGDYLEGDDDWMRRNAEALAWLADNHAAIRASLLQPRAAVLLRAARDLIRGEAVTHGMEVHYDSAVCDGDCLAQDIETLLGIDEDTPLAEYGT